MNRIAKIICIYASVLYQCVPIESGETRSLSFTRICKHSELANQCVHHESDERPVDLVGHVLKEFLTSSELKCSVSCASLDDCKVYGFHSHTPRAGTCVLLKEYFNCTVLTSGTQQCYNFKAKVNSIDT